MNFRIRSFLCGISAAFMMASASVTAFADHTYQLDNSDGLCFEVIADSKEINGTEGVFETEFGDSSSEDYFSLRFKLFNEYLDSETWNSDDLTVSVEVKLETAGADVIGCLPAFNSEWAWINPSDYVPLVYNEWVTVSEKGSHFYTDFAKAEPNDILFQVRTNWGADAQGKVKLSVRNFTISDGESAVAVTSPAEEETSAPVENPVITEESPVTVEAAVTSDASTGSAETDTNTAEAVQPEQTTTAPPSTSATTIRTAATVATSAPINYSELYAQPKSPVGMIIAIVAVAVVVVVGAVIGYLIYRKKKFY